MHADIIQENNLTQRRHEPCRPTDFNSLYTVVTSCDPS